MAQRRDLNKSNSKTVSDAAARMTPSGETRSSKQIPAKCVRCAHLSMAQVRSLHGEAGDNCYVSDVCRSQRSYARHRDQRNQTRRQKWHETKAGVDVNPVETQVIAQLIVYREP